MSLNAQERIEANWFSKPGDSIRTNMHRKGISADRVADQLEGGMETFRGILDGTIAIDGDIARELTLVLGGTTAFWLKRQMLFEDALKKAVDVAFFAESEQWLDHVPVPNPRIRGRLTEAKCKAELKRRLIHFNVATFKAWNSHYGKVNSDTRFRTSQSFESKDKSVLLWLRRGELEAELVTTKHWDVEALKERLDSIRKLSRVHQPAKFLPKLRDLLAGAGVALAVVKTPNGCHASGASRLIAPDKAMILMSFRHRADDQFWFTLFHEIGHLVLHNGETFVDQENMPDLETEQEANDFARRLIIPEEFEQRFYNLKDDRRSILRFGMDAEIAPGLIVGQLQHHKIIGYNRKNSLKRRWKWEEINPAMV